MSSYKKHAKCMVILLSTLAFLLAGPWLFSLYFVFAEKPLFIPASYWVKNAIEVKEDRIQHRPEGEKAIIIISGSNSLFGINSPTIERLTGYNLYNFGIHAALPLCLYIHFVKKYAQKGDIIIAPLEYGYHARGNELTPNNYANFSTWGMKYAHTLPRHWQRELLWRNICTYCRRLPNLDRKLPIEDTAYVLQKTKTNGKITCPTEKFSYKASTLNMYGEHLEDKQPTKDNFESSYFKKEPISAYFKQEIADFQSYLTQRGVSLYITFPVTEKQSLFDTDTPETQEKLKFYREQIESCGVNFFGTDSFYNLENKYFFNTPYHLNATGSILRSLLLAEDINTYVLGKEPSYDHSSPEAQKAFFEQQEQEALRIIEELREEQRIYEENHSPE